MEDNFKIMWKMYIMGGKEQRTEIKDDFPFTALLFKTAESVRKMNLLS